jgi:predicted nicotinamide N-methyase
LDPALFIRRNTAIAAPPLVPEIQLHLATEVTPIWQASEESLARGAVPPPFWAFAWAGGQALARYLIDRPETVAGRFVFDFGSGSGLVAIAAAKAGARAVLAAEIDDFARAAIAANAALNDVVVEVMTADAIDADDPSWEIVTAGDVCYERDMRIASSHGCGHWRGVVVLCCSATPGAPICRRKACAHLRPIPSQQAESSKTARPATASFGGSCRPEARSSAGSAAPI